MKPLEERVKDGAVYLDNQVPGWEHNVNLEILDMDCTGNCVLGQMYGSYRFGKDELKATDEKLRELGFDLYCDEPDQLADTYNRNEIEVLEYWNSLWATEIRNRLNRI